MNAPPYNGLLRGLAAASREAARSLESPLMTEDWFLALGLPATESRGYLNLERFAANKGRAVASL